MRYLIEHVTRYRYAVPAAACRNEVRLTPRHDARQSVEECQIVVDPVPAAVAERDDYFGNRVHHVVVLDPHAQLTIAASSIVDVRDGPAPGDGGGLWEAVGQQVGSGADEATLRAYEFRCDSPFVETSQALADYGRRTFAAGVDLRNAVLNLSRMIHDEFVYVPQVTTVETTAAEVFVNRRGVCQDFAHVMIGVLRSLGLAARYVSGYVRTESGLTGAQASHAWVAVFMGGDRWLEVDPTNDVEPGLEHVRVAWGRDYSDVTPVKGVTLGGGEHAVDVDVRVAPVGSDDGAPT